MHFLIENGSIAPTQVTHDAEGDEVKVKGTVAKLRDPAQFDGLMGSMSQVASDLASTIGNMFDAEEHRILQSRIYACLSIGLRGSFVVNGEPDWDGTSAGYKLAWGEVLSQATQTYLAALENQARGLEDEKARKDALEQVWRRSKKIRLAFASKVNMFTADILRGGLGITGTGAAAERSKIVLAMFTGDGSYSLHYPAVAVKVLKGGLPAAWYLKGDRKLKSPEATARAAKDKKNAAENRSAIQAVVGDATPEFIRDAVAAATIQEPVEVTADNGTTVIQHLNAAARILAGQIQSMNAQLANVETAVDTLPLGSVAAAETITVNLADVFRTISRESDALADRVNVLAHSLGDRLIAPTPEEASGDTPEGTPETPEPEPKPKQRRKVAAIK